MLIRIAVNGKNMKKFKLHLLLAPTLLVLIIGFLILLSPQFEESREALGIPAHLYGSRYDPKVGAAEIIPQEGGKDYLARLTFIYHSIFALLIYAMMIPLIVRKGIDESILDLTGTGAILTVLGGLFYAYLGHFHLWHGIFITGLAMLFFFTGLMVLIKLKPKDLLEVNIWLSGLFMVLGAIIGGFLGSSFMKERDYFVKALITSRFNSDLSEGNVLWRALTAHEHAMLMLALTLVFLVGVSFLKFKEDRGTKASLYMITVGEVLAAIASYAVWPLGKVAHMVITPAALILLMGTTLLSLKAGGRDLKWGLVVGNMVMWVAVAFPGAIVAMSLRTPLFFNPPFRDPSWDWAELAYNVGHWHILLGMWGVILLLIYLSWPSDLMGSSIAARLGGWLSLLGFAAAAVSVNLYMLGNPPGPYSPNPYNNLWMSLLVEPSLSIMSIGIAISYLYFLFHHLRQP